MTLEEFERFKQEVKACLPGLAQQLASYWRNGDGQINDDSRQITLSRWQSALANVDIKDAMLAIKRIFEGEIARPFPDEFIAVIRRESLMLSRRRESHSLSPGYADERRYSCHTCLDSGFAEVVSQDTLERVRHGKSPRELLNCHYSSLRCNCETGKKRAERVSMLGKDWHVMRTDEPEEDLKAATELVYERFGRPTVV